MSLPHNYSTVAAIMGAVVGAGGGTPTNLPRITSVTGPTDVDEGSPATINVATENFPDGETALNWEIASNAGDFVVASGEVVIEAGAIQTVYQVVTGATVSISEEEGDTVYNYIFGGTLSGAGLGFGFPVLQNEQIGTSGYYRGDSTGVVGQYQVTRRVTIGGNGTASFTVTPELDGVEEESETFTVRVFGTVNGTSVTRTSLPITINDVTNAIDIPRGTFIAREGVLGTSNIVTFQRAENASQDGETVTALASVRTQIRKENFGQFDETTGILIVAIAMPPSSETGGYDSSIWYSPNGTPNPMPIGEEIQLYRNEQVVPTRLRIQYRLQGTTAWTNLGYQDADEGDIATFTRRATAGAGGDQFTDAVVEVQYFARVPGFNDTMIAEFIFRVEAYADGANF